MKTVAGTDIALYAFLSLESDQPLGIFIGHKHGASYITLDEFIEESKADLSHQMRQLYAGAFEILAKQLRDV